MAIQRMYPASDRSGSSEGDDMLFFHYLPISQTKLLIGALSTENIIQL